MYAKKVHIRIYVCVYVYIGPRYIHAQTWERTRDERLLA